MKARLEATDSDLITEVRGRGLWIGVEFDPAKVAARAVCERLMERGILTKETHSTVVRFAPPFVITRSELDWAMDTFAEVVAELTAEISRSVAGAA